MAPSDLERQQPVAGGVEQSVVGQGTAMAVAMFEGLEVPSEPARERDEIGVLVDHAAGNQHAIGADAKADRPPLDSGNCVEGQAVADAIEFRKRAAPRCGIDGSEKPAPPCRRHPHD